jgi:Tol biopolymer transport system component
VGTSAEGQRLYRTSSGSGPLVPLTPFARFVAFQLEPGSRFAIVTLNDGPPLASGTLAVRLADGAARVIEPAGVSVVKSTSDGHVFLYLAAPDGELELFAFDLVRGVRQRLNHTLAPGTRVSEFTFSSVTGQVAYTTSEPGAAPLWIVPSDGSTPAAPVLATTTGPALHPQPSPDGQSFTFAAPTAPGRVDLFRVASTGGVASNLSAASGGFAGLQRLGTVPGDARLLVLDSRGALFSLPTAGGDPLLLASGRLHLGRAGFALSPDGRTTYLGRTDAANRTRIVALPVAGGPEQVLSGTLDVGLAYDLGPLPLLSPDGRWLAFLVEGSSSLSAELVAVPTDGSRPPQRLHEAGQLPVELFVAGRKGIYFIAVDDALLNSNGLYLRTYASLSVPRKR